VRSGLAAMELARGDGSIYTFFGATSGFAINTIANLGSDEQKEKWIPGMARLEKLGAFALTEPEHGSDAVMLQTRARREGDEYVIDGKKRWIGNGTVADVIIIWARDENDGFLVEKGSPGLKATGIIYEQNEGCLSARGQGWPVVSASLRARYRRSASVAASSSAWR
jgi:glutaryl-CoA dehydrogenase